MKLANRRISKNVRTSDSRPGMFESFKRTPEKPKGTLGTLKKSQEKYTKELLSKYKNRSTRAKKQDRLK